MSNLTEFSSFLTSELEKDSFASLKPEERGGYVSSLTNQFLEHYSPDEGTQKAIREESENALSSYRHTFNEPRYQPTQEELQSVALPTPKFSATDSFEKREKGWIDWANNNISKFASDDYRPAEKEDIEVFFNSYANQGIREAAFAENKTSNIGHYAKTVVQGLAEPISRFVASLADGPEGAQAVDRFFAGVLAEDPSRKEEVGTMIAAGIGDVGTQLAISATGAFVGGVLGGPGGAVAGASVASSAYNVPRYMTEGFNREWERTGNESQAWDAAVSQIPAALLETAGDMIFLRSGSTMRGFAKAFAQETTEEGRRKILSKAVQSYPAAAGRGFLSEGLVGGVGSEWASGLGLAMATGHDEYYKQSMDGLMKSGFAEGVVGAMFGVGFHGAKKSGQAMQLSKEFGAIQGAQDIADKKDPAKLQKDIFDALQRRDFRKVTELTSDKLISDPSLMKEAQENYDASRGLFTNPITGEASVTAPVIDTSTPEGQKAQTHLNYRKAFGSLTKTYQSMYFDDTNPTSELGKLTANATRTPDEQKRFEFLSNRKKEIEDGTYKPNYIISTNVTQLPPTNNIHGPDNNSSLGAYQVTLNDGTPLEQGGSTFYLNDKKEAPRVARAIASLNATHGDRNISFVTSNEEGIIHIRYQKPNGDWVYVGDGAKKNQRPLRISASFKPSKGSVPVVFNQNGDDVSFELGSQSVKDVKKVPRDFEVVQPMNDKGEMVVRSKRNPNNIITISGSIAKAVQLEEQDRNQTKEEKDRIRQEKKNARKKKVEEDTTLSKEEIDKELEAIDNEMAEDADEMLEEVEATENDPSIFEQLEQQQKKIASDTKVRGDYTLAEAKGKRGYIGTKRGTISQAKDGSYEFVFDDTSETPVILGGAGGTIAEAGVNRNITNNARQTQQQNSSQQQAPVVQEQTPVTPVQQQQEQVVNVPILPETNESVSNVRAELKKLFNNPKLDEKIDNLTKDAVLLIGNAINQGFTYELVTREEFVRITENARAKSDFIPAVSKYFEDTNTVRNLFVKSSMERLTQKEFEDVLTEETFHGAAHIILRDDPKLWDAAGDEVLLDEDLNKAMRGFYPSWDGLSKDGKTFEAIRAINQGRYTKEVSNGFKKLLQKFLKYVDQFFGTSKNRNVQVFTMNVEKFLGVERKLDRNALAVYNKIVRGYDLTDLEYESKKVLDYVADMLGIPKGKKSKLDTLASIKAAQSQMFPSESVKDTTKVKSDVEGGQLNYQENTLEGQPIDVTEEDTKLAEEPIEENVEEATNANPAIDQDIESSITEEDKATIVEELGGKSWEGVRQEFKKQFADFVSGVGKFSKRLADVFNNIIKTLRTIAFTSVLAFTPTNSSYIAPITQQEIVAFNANLNQIQQREFNTLPEGLPDAQLNIQKAGDRMAAPESRNSGLLGINIPTNEKEISSFDANLNKVQQKEFNTLPQELPGSQLNIPDTENRMGIPEVMNPTLRKFMPSGMPGVQGRDFNLDSIPQQTLPTGTSNNSISVPKSNTPISIEANFFGAKASRQVTDTANWILKSGNNEGKPFVVADKRGGMLYLFDANGELNKKTPALFGKDIGDKANLNSTFEDENASKVTPTGRFAGDVVSDAEYGDTVDFLRSNADWNLAIHKTYLGTPSEQRLKKLETPDPKDNRISYGCINCSESVMKQNIVPLFKNDGGFVYVLPETIKGANEFVKQTGIPKELPFAEIIPSDKVESLSVKGNYGAWIHPNADLNKVKASYGHDWVAQEEAEKENSKFTKDQIKQAKSSNFWNDLLLDNNYVRVVNRFDKILVEARSPLTSSQKKTLEWIGMNDEKNVIQYLPNGSDRIIYNHDAVRDIPFAETVARHSELEAKYNDGTITPEETAEAEALVNNVAKKAGYDINVFRGDPVKEAIRVFDINKAIEAKGTNILGPGFYFTDKEVEAKIYGNVNRFFISNPNPLVIRYPLTIKEYLGVDLDKRLKEQSLGTREEAIADTLEGSFIEPWGDMFLLKNKNRMDVMFLDKSVFLSEGFPLGKRLDFDNLKKIAKLGYEKKEGVSVENDVFSYQEDGEVIYRKYLENLRNYLLDQGYTGVKSTEVRRGNAAANLLMPDGSTHHVVFNPNQIKSAEPFTGVPLDKRFDKTSNDVAFAENPNDFIPEQNQQPQDLVENIPGIFGIPDGSISPERAEKMRQLRKTKSRKIEARMMPEEKKAFQALKNLKHGAMLSDESFNKYIEVFNRFIDTRRKTITDLTERETVEEILNMSAEFKNEADTNMFNNLKETMPEAFLVDGKDMTFEDFDRNFDRVRVQIQSFLNAQEVGAIPVPTQTTETRESFEDRIYDMRQEIYNDREGFLGQTLSYLDDVLQFQVSNGFASTHINKGIDLMRQTVEDARAFYNEYINFLVDADLSQMSDKQVREIYYSLMGASHDSYILAADNFVSGDIINILSNPQNFIDGFTGRGSRQLITNISSVNTQLRQLTGNREAYLNLLRLTSRFNESVKRSEMFLQQVMVPYQKDTLNFIERKFGRKLTTFNFIQSGMYAELTKVRDDETVQGAIEANIAQLKKSFQTMKDTKDKGFVESANQLLSDLDSITGTTLEEIEQKAKNVLGADVVEYTDMLRQFFNHFEPMAKFTTEFVYGREYHRFHNYMPTAIKTLGKDGKESMNEVEAHQALLNMTNQDRGEVNINTTGMASTFDKTRGLGRGQVLELNINYLYSNRGRLNILDYFTSISRREMSNVMRPGTEANVAFGKFIGDEKGLNGRTEVFNGAVLQSFRNVVESTQYIAPFHGLVNNLVGRWAGMVLSSAYQLPIQFISNLMPWMYVNIGNPGKLADFWSAASYLIKYKSGKLNEYQTKMVERLLFDMKNRNPDAVLDKNVELAPSKLLDWMKNLPGYDTLEKLDKGREWVQFKPFMWSDMLSGDPIILTEYLHNLRQKTGNKNITLEDMTYDAGSYFAALDETERFVGIGHASRRGKWMNNKNALATVVRHMLTGFASHRVNNATNAMSEWRKIINPDTSISDKAKSFQYMSGIALQSAIFTYGKMLAIQMLMGAFKNILSGDEDEDELVNLYNRRKEAMSADEKKLIDIEISKRREIRKVWNQIKQKEDNSEFLALQIGKDAISNIFVIPAFMEFVPDVFIWTTLDASEKEAFSMMKAQRQEELKRGIKNATNLQEYNAANRMKLELSDLDSLEAVQLVNTNYGTAIPMAGMYGGALKNMESLWDAVRDEYFMNAKPMDTKDFLTAASAFGFGFADMQRYFRLQEKITKAEDKASEKIKNLAGERN